MLPLVPLLLLLLLPAVLYSCSQRCRYCMRMAVMYGGGLLIGGCISLLACLAPLAGRRPSDPRNSLLFTRPLRVISWLLGIDWEVRGAHLLTPDTACVVTANHQSVLDVLGVVELWPHLGRVVTVMKREVWVGLPAALACWLLGNVLIDRSNPAQARASLARAQGRVRDERLAVWFFPEGTRHRGAGLLPFKKGAFHMAVQAQVPLVPVVFAPYSGFFDPPHWRFEPGRAVVQVLEPVPTADLTEQDIPRLVHTVRDKMAAVYLQLTDEMEVGKAA